MLTKLNRDELCPNKMGPFETVRTNTLHPNGMGQLRSWPEKPVNTLHEGGCEHKLIPTKQKFLMLGFYNKSNKLLMSPNIS